MPVKLPLLQDGLHVWKADRAVLRVARVAAAVGTERAAEGDVNVDGRARAQSLGLFKPRAEALDPLGFGRVPVPVEHRRVARVTRPRHVVLLQKLGRCGSHLFPSNPPAISPSACGIIPRADAFGRSFSTRRAGRQTPNRAIFMLFSTPRPLLTAARTRELQSPCPRVTRITGARDARHRMGCDSSRSRRPGAAKECRDGRRNRGMGRLSRSKNSAG